MRIRRLRVSDPIEGFCSGDSGLDRYLRSYATNNQEVMGIGVTYVVPSEGGIAGFVTLVAGSIKRDDTPAERSGVYPRYPLPILRVARLAVDSRAQGAGLGSALVAFARQVADTMRSSVGCVGMVVDALPAATAYYELLGFRPIRAVEGSSAARPRPVPMYLSLNDTRTPLENE